MTKAEQELENSMADNVVRLNPLPAIPAATWASPREEGAAAGPRLVYGRIVRVLGPTVIEVTGAPVATRYEVEFEGACATATRTVSCLVEPLAGDMVLLSSPATDKLWFILAVVDRQGIHETVLSADGDLALRLPSGKLDLATRDGAAITSAGEVDIAAPRLLVNTLDTSVISDKLALSARAASITAAGLSIAADAIDTVAERISERVKRVYRKVEELDQLRAFCVDYLAKGTVRIHSKHTVVSADEAAKIDAKNVYLG
jgi:hypothetical protein